jgi:hypothetical protein
VWSDSRKVRLIGLLVACGVVNISQARNNLILWGRGDLLFRLSINCYQ